MINIPVLGIYGEDEFSEGADFIHIEAMGSRAREFEGKITPHIHRNMFQVMLAMKGSCTVKIEGVVKKLKSPCVLFIPGGTVHSLEFESESQGWAVTGSEHLLSRHSEGQLFKLLTPVIGTPYTHPFNADSENYKQICWLLEQMLKEYKESNYGRNIAILTMMDLLMLLLSRELTDNTKVHVVDQPTLKAFSRFRRLIETHYVEHLNVDYYADKIGLTTLKLNKICRQYADKSAHEILQSRLLLEAQRLLTYSSSSATEISFTLGFQDPAYFNRFFKRCAGVSPIKFREAKHH